MAPFSVVLSSCSLDKFYESVSFLAAARARGDKTILFLRGPALNAFVEDRWETPPALDPKTILQMKNQSPSHLLKEAHQGGNVAVYACSAWVRLLDLDNAVVAARVDAVVGLNAFLSQAQGGPILYLS